MTHAPMYRATQFYFIASNLLPLYGACMEGSQSQLYLQKEHYLGLSVGNDNWWRTNGIGCEKTGDRDGSGTGDSNSTGECKASYAVSNKRLQ